MSYYIPQTPSDVTVISCWVILLIPYQDPAVAASELI